jgi:hypothetical protein
MGQFIHCPIFYFPSGKTQVKRDERSELKLVRVSELKLANRLSLTFYIFTFLLSLIVEFKELLLDYPV